MKKQTKLGKIVLASAVIAVAASVTSEAAVIGYWRFENTTTVGLDSSGNSNTLTAAAGTPVSTAIPVSGLGSSFLDPVPQTGAANDRLTTLGNTTYLQLAGLEVLGAQTFEAFVSNTSYTFTGFQKYVASNFGSAGNRSSAFGVLGGTSGQLSWVVSTDGTVLTTLTSSFSTGLVDNNDYYIAYAFDPGTSVTFYRKNLTTGGALESSVVSTGITSIFNSSAAFQLGSVGGGNGWGNVIDEVRWSNTALSSSQLLVTVPEPSTFAMLGLAAGAVALMRRRRA